MKTTALTLIALLIATIASCVDVPVLTVEFCRHGARAPVDYPFGKHILHDFDVGVGNLTPGGMRMHTLIGDQLRRDLVFKRNVLPTNYDINSMFVYSDTLNRTIQSAESQMYGLYPLGTGLQMENIASIERSIPPLQIDDLGVKELGLGFNALRSKLSPIPVLHWNITEELLACPYLTQNNPLVNPSLLKEVLDKIFVYLPQISKWTGISEDLFKEDPPQIVYAVDTVVCNYYAGYDVPNFNPEADLESAIEVLRLGIYFATSATSELARIRANPMLSSLKSLIEGVVKDESTTKFVLFSGHDSDLAPLLTALGQPQYYPYFASTAIFQLYKKSTTEQDVSRIMAEDSSSSSVWDDYYIKASFNDEELKFSGCSSNPCPAEQFITFLNTVLLPNWAELCNAP